MFSIMKNKRLLILAFFIILSIALISPNPNPHGMKITFVDKNASVGDLRASDTIYSINDAPATQELIQKEYYGIVKLDTNRGMKFLNINGTLGIDAERVQNANLKFGLDLKGGIRAIVEPNTTNTDEINQIVSTLQTRINVFGLKEASFRSLVYQDKKFIEISIAGGNTKELRDLLESQGKFEAKIPLRIKITNNAGILKLDKNYDVVVTNYSINIGNITIKSGENFKLADIEFVAGEVKENYLNLTAVVFSGTDIKTVFFDPQRSTVEKGDGFYRWSFVVQISNDGAQKFAYVTSNLGVLPGGYLDSQISFYLDNKPLDSLNIASSLRGRVETTISITGSAKTLDEAVNEKSKLQSILRSGALPASIQIAQIETISPKLGEDFMKNAALAAIGAIIGIVIVVSARYRKIKIILPMVLISLSEVLIILGLAALISWTIDLAAIGGIIASVGTGVDSQIIIIDQALRGEDARIITMKEKLKRAFFIIFGSAGTVIAAMLPLMFLGFGLLRGFAITTVIGVLVGIFITRPAFGTIVEKLVK